MSLRFPLFGIHIFNGPDPDPDPEPEPEPELDPETDPEPEPEPELDPETDPEPDPDPERPDFSVFYPPLPSLFLQPNLLSSPPPSRR